jgi:uncharacterized cupin superfamily protein
MMKIANSAPHTVQGPADWNRRGGEPVEIRPGDIVHIEPAARENCWGKSNMMMISREFSAYQ